MNVRRVVTGHTPSGKATVASDTEVAAVTLSLLPGTEFNQLWGGDEAPIFPDDGSPSAAPTYYPPVGGFRFGLFTVAPLSVALPKDFNPQSALAEMEERLPGLATHLEANNPGMHTTNTIDFEYVLSGEVWLELDDGKEVHLRTGDTVVQNGTRHAWRNKSAEPCRLLLCGIGAHRQTTDDTQPGSYRDYRCGPLRDLRKSLPNVKGF